MTRDKAGTSTTDEIGPRIRAAREARGLTRTQPACILDVTEQAVSAWEVGKRHPGLNNLVRVATTCGVTVDHLLDREAVS